MSLWGANNVPAANNKPTFAQANNSKWYGNCYGVRRGQVDVAGNPPVAMSGWVGVKHYTDSLGNVRWKLETLVAMSSLTGDDPNADTFFPNSTS
jgi:hypothetical protein